MYFNIQHRNLHVNEIRGYGTADIGRKNPKAIESLSLMSDKKFAQNPQSEEHKSKFKYM